MQYSEGRLGRIFTLRLEDGERLPDVLEAFAREQGLQGALVFFLGGAQHGSRVVVGPEAGRETVVPLIHVLQGIQEVLAVGTIFPNEEGQPVMHLHAASGREGGATVGCTRAGVEVWLVGEVVILEILGTSGQRLKDPGTGFELLQFA
ncbi:MAG: PPC domain-containing DNA-binding protein [Thermodesulfobacteriota bacterium]